MMRVLHVSPYFAPAFCYGGPPRSILGLCKAQQQLGAEVTVFTTTAAGPSRFEPAVEAPAEYDGLRVFRFPLGLAARFFHAPQLGRAIASRFSQFDVAHIHGMWNITEWTAARACRRAMLPYVISTRGMLHAVARRHRAWRKQLAYRVMEAAILRQALFLHATSSAEVRAIEALAVNREIVELPNGIDLSREICQPRGLFRAQYGIDPSVPLIAWMGRIHPIKRLDILAAAFLAVHSAVPAARLVLAGPDEGGHREVLAPLFAPFGEAVIWTGELTAADKTLLLADANLLVACSDVESFGMSIAEAMAAALPVVATHTCPWPQIEQEGCGRWVPHDSQAVAQAVLEIIDNPQQAEMMGTRGRRFVSENYSWDSIATRMLAHYEHAVSKQRARSQS